MSVIGPQVGDQVRSISGANGEIISVDDSACVIRDEHGNEQLVQLEELLAEKPFLVFPCDIEHKGCGDQVVLDVVLGIGQAAVLECDNCGTSWTVLNPSLEIYRTDAYEDIWPHTSQ